MITGLYSGILGLILLFLAMRVSGERMKEQAALGIDDSPALFEAVRRHGNFVEWVPFALLLMVIYEFNGGATALLHGVGASLVTARLIHPWGIKHHVIPHPLRAIGAGITFAIVLVLSVAVLWQSLSLQLG